MKPFRSHRGLVAPLDRPNVDTDQIVPKQFLKRIERSGFGKFLFYDWAHDADGKPDAAFVLHQPRYRGASIMVAGRNFGCGSSREHAPWAIADFGFRAVVAPSFADIFATNCVKNGLVTATLAEAEVAELLRRATDLPDYHAMVDLETCTVTDDQGFQARFAIDEFRRHCLLNGLDDISLTLRHELQIAEYERRFRSGIGSWSPDVP